MIPSTKKMCIFEEETNYNLMLKKIRKIRIKSQCIHAEIPLIIFFCDVKMLLQNVSISNYFMKFAQIDLISA